MEMEGTGVEGGDGRSNFSMDRCHHRFWLIRKLGLEKIGTLSFHRNRNSSETNTV